MRQAVRLLGVALVTGLLASCSQLGPSVPGQVRVEAPANASPSAGPPVLAAAKATSTQLGVQIFWHDVNEKPGTNWKEHYRRISCRACCGATWRSRRIPRNCPESGSSTWAQAPA